MIMLATLSRIVGLTRTGHAPETRSAPVSFRGDSRISLGYGQHCFGNNATLSCPERWSSHAPHEEGHAPEAIAREVLTCFSCRRFRHSDKESMVSRTVMIEVQLNSRMARMADSLTIVRLVSLSANCRAANADHGLYGARRAWSDVGPGPCLFLVSRRSIRPGGALSADA